MHPFKLFFCECVICNFLFAVGATYLSHVPLEREVLIFNGIYVVEKKKYVHMLPESAYFFFKFYVAFVAYLYIYIKPRVESYLWLKKDENMLVLYFLIKEINGTPVPTRSVFVVEPPTGKKNTWPRAHTHTHTHARKSPAGALRVDVALQLLTQCGISICATSYVPLTLSKVRLHHINDASFESSSASRNHAGRSGGTPYFQGSSSLSKAAICVGEDVQAAAGTWTSLVSSAFEVMSSTLTLPGRTLGREVTVLGPSEKEAGEA